MSSAIYGGRLLLHEIYEHVFENSSRSAYRNRRNRLSGNLGTARLRRRRLKPPFARTGQRGFQWGVGAWRAQAQVEGKVRRILRLGIAPLGAEGLGSGHREMSERGMSQMNASGQRRQQVQNSVKLTDILGCLYMRENTVPRRKAKCAIAGGGVGGGWADGRVGIYPCIRGGAHAICGTTLPNMEGVVVASAVDCSRPPLACVELARLAPVEQ